MLEEFENRGFTLNIVRPHNARKIEKATITGQFGFVFEDGSDKKIT